MGEEIDYSVNLEKIMIKDYRRSKMTLIDGKGNVYTPEVSQLFPKVK